MEEIKTPKKERKFLKAVGNIAKVLANELVMGIARKFIGKAIDKVGNKRQGLSMALIIIASTSAFAQYPTTSNKQRLGFQTTGDGLVWRGSLSDTATIQPINNQNAWVILDTINLKFYTFDFTSNVWNLVGGGGAAFTQPVDSLFFNVNVPTNNVDTAKMRWDSDLATVVLGLNDNVPNELGFKNFWLVKNQTGTTITKGSLVYANGTVGSSGRITVAKFIANGSIDAKYLLGITAHDLTDGEDGYVISFGKIRQVNTDTFAAGAILYPSPTVAGVWTDIEPVAPNLDMPIGFCINSAINTGTIAIRVASGYKLSELHDVSITSPVENSSLYYKGGLWRDTTAALLTSDTASMLLPYLRDADTVSLSNRINLKLNIADTSAFARDNQISGTSGQVAYFNSSSSVVSDTALRWSAANKSLGINMKTVPSGANLILKNSQEPVRSTVVATQTFGADTTNWTRGAGWTFNGTQAVATAATGNLTYTPSLTITAGNAYEVTYTLSGYSAGTLTAAVGNVTYNLPSYNITNVVVLLPTNATGGFRFTTSTFTGNLDNISIVQISNPAPILFAGQDDDNNTLYNSIVMPNLTSLSFGGGARYTTGTSNFSHGSGLEKNTTGNNNIFIGINNGLNNTTGSNNVFFGQISGQNNTIGNNNYFFGERAGQFNTSGSRNYFFGTTTGQNNTVGNDNVFFGTAAGFSNLSGSNNFFFGVNAGNKNTTGASNNFIGFSAGFSMINGSSNNFIGVDVGRNATTGNNNNFIGADAGNINTGSTNNFIGFRAGYFNTSGGNNNFIGSNAGYLNRIGSFNSFFGGDAGYVNKSGSNNVSIGYRSMYNTVTADSLSGSNNIALGTNAADNIAGAAAGNVAIGNAVDLPTNNGSNQGVYQNVLFFTGASGTGTTIAAASKAGIKTNAPNRDLEVAGEVRITDLTTDAPTRLVGADAEGDLGQVTLGAGLSLASSSLLADTSFLVTRFDTASMLTPYFRDADTTSLNLTSRFAAKLNISDTASMLTNYLRTGTAASTYLPLTGGTLTGDLGISKSSNSILRLSSADVGSYGKLIFSSNNGGYLNYGASIESSGDGVGIDVGSLNFLTGFGTVRTNRMTITPTGNLTIVNSATIGGTLGVTGATTLTGGIKIIGTTDIFNGQPFSTLQLIPAPTIGSTDNTIQTINTTGLSFKIGLTERMKINSSGLLTVTDAATFNSGAVFNEAATDSDFRVESEANAHMLFVDASTSRVGIGTNSPTKTLDVNGELNVLSAGTFGGRLNTNWLERTYSNSTSTSLTVSVNTTWLKLENNSTITLTLPNAATYPGKELHIKNAGTGAVNSLSSNIEPLNSTTIGTAILASGGGKWATLVSDGTYWVIMAGN